MPAAQVTENSGALLVPLVEAGWYSPDDPVVTETLKRYLKPFSDNNVDTLILGCTHFPVLAPAISRIMGDGVRLINMGAAAAQVVKQRLNDADALGNAPAAEHKFFVSDKAASFRQMAELLLSEKINENMVFRADVSGL